MRMLFLGVGLLVQVVYGAVLLMIGFSRTPLSRWLDEVFLYIVTVAVVTWIGYIVDVTRNERLSKEKKALWIAVLVFGTIFGELAYFFIHVVPRRVAAPLSQ